MKILIIEDEKLSAQRLEKMIRQYNPQTEVLARIPSVAKAREYFSGIANGTAPDLIFMDIHLEDDNAFRILDTHPITIPIIFTTAFDQYTLRAFKTNSVDYLLKPIDENELNAALDKFKKVHLWNVGISAASLENIVATLQPKPKSYRRRFMASIGTRLISIDTLEIAYFFYRDKSVWIVTTDGRQLPIEYSLDKIVAMTNPEQFFRINRSFLVCMPAIRSVQSYSGSKIKLELTPQPGQEVLVSSDRIADFKLWLGK